MSEGAFVARFSPWRLGLGLLGGLGFVAYGIYLGGMDDPIAPFVGYGAAAVFGTFCLIGVVRLGRRGPALQLDATGIRQWLNWRERVVPWSAVTAIEEVSLHHQRFFYVWLDEPDRWVGRRALGDHFGHLALSTHATDRRFAELREAVRRFAPADLTSPVLHR